MADLSHLLGDVYSDPDGPPVRHEPSAAARVPSVPEWAGDEALDQAFSAWTPGPPADAPEAERTIMEPASPSGLPLDDDLAAALSAALASAPAAPETPADKASADVQAEFVVAPEPVTATDNTTWLSAPAINESDLDTTEILPDLGTVLGEPAHETVFVGSDFLVDEPEPARPWQRSDDDILPRSSRRGLRLFRR